jgi:hypothetical protein
MPGFLARLRGRLSPGTVIASIALFVALGGTSVAAIAVNSVGKAQIRTNAVGKSEIRSGAVGRSEIASGGVGKGEIASNAVGGSEVRANAIDSDEIADGGIQAADLSTSARGSLQSLLLKAAVNSVGAPQDGNAKTSTRVAEGNYQVEFNQDVSGCEYLVTLAAVRNGAGVDQPVAGRITAASGGTTKVNVSTYGVAGAASDQPFHLIVAC